MGCKLIWPAGKRTAHAWGDRRRNNGNNRMLRRSGQPGGLAEMRRMEIFWMIFSKRRGRTLLIEKMPDYL